MRRTVALFGMYVAYRVSCFHKVLRFRIHPIYVYIYFIRCPAAEHATSKRNLTRLSPCVSVWPARLVVNGFYWPGWILGYEDAEWLESCAVMSICFVLKSRWVLELLSLVEQSHNRERIRKMALLLLHSFAFSCIVCGFWATIWVLLITKEPKEEASVLK